MECTCDCCRKHSVKALVKKGFHKVWSDFLSCSLVCVCAREEDGRTKVLYVCAGRVLGDHGDGFGVFRCALCPLTRHRPTHRLGTVTLWHRYSLVPLKDNPYKVHLMRFVGRNIRKEFKNIRKDLKDANWWNLEALSPCRLLCRWAMCFIRSILTSEFKGICMAFICNLFELGWNHEEKQTTRRTTHLSSALKSFWGLPCRRLEMVFVVVELVVWTWTQNDAAQGELGIFDAQTLLLTMLGLGQAGNEKSQGMVKIVLR